MSTTITVNPVVIQIDSVLQHTEIVNSQPSLYISQDCALPSDPTFNSVTVLTDVEIQDDLDVLDNLYVGDTLTVEDQINTENLMCNTDAFFVDVDIAGDASMARARIGDQAGNYSVFEDDGTLVQNGNARTHEDLNFDVLNSGGNPTTIPDYVIINNLVYREFTSANNQSCGGAKEVPHAAFLGGQTLIPHCHIFLKSGESAGTTGVTFTLYWELRQGGSTTNGSVTVSATSAQLTENPHKIDLYAATGFACSTTLGGQLAMRIARTGGNAGDVVAITYGVHHENDMTGSHTASTK